MHRLTLTRRAALALLPAAAARAEPAPPDLGARLHRLVASYPDQLAGLEGDMLVWRDGTRAACGAALPARPFETMLRSATIADQLRLNYAAGPLAAPPEDSPGRLRNTAFFRKLYGDCARGEVAPRLRSVRWLPGPGGAQLLPVTTVNDVAGRLERVVAALAALPDRFRGFLIPAAGSFNCRTVLDSGVPSMHGTGAAIDIAVAFSDYWAWSRGIGVRPWRNRIPFEIVAAFEAEHFIWGGKWRHFDTMHFEYRPELFPA